MLSTKSTGWFQTRQQEWLNLWSLLKFTLSPTCIYTPKINITLCYRCQKKQQYSKQRNKQQKWKKSQVTCSKPPRSSVVSMALLIGNTSSWWPVRSASSRTKLDLPLDDVPTCKNPSWLRSETSFFLQDIAQTTFADNMRPCPPISFTLLIYTIFSL